MTHSERALPAKATWSSQPYPEQAGEQADDFTPLTRAEADKISAAQTPVSLWAVVAGQMAAALLMGAAAWIWTGQTSGAVSALYGGLAVVVPAAFFARGLSRQKASGNVGSALTGFFVWELVKIALTVAMLVAAPKLILQLNWLALLAGFVVTMKVYWLAVWLRLVRGSSVRKF